MSTTQYPNIPAIPLNVKDEETRAFLRALKENMELLTGKKGEKDKYKALTKNEINK